MVIFEDCRVPVANCLGEEADGFKIAMMGPTAAASIFLPAHSAGCAPASKPREVICWNAVSSAGRSPTSKHCSSSSSTWRPSSTRPG
jgi:hypothetical protein